MRTTRPLHVLLLLALGVAAAHAQEPAPAIYTLQVWISPTGAGIARTIGPMTQERCEYNIGVLRGATYADVPPDMELRTLQCASKANLQWWFLAYGCSAASNNPVPKHPEYRLWVYTCFSR